MSIFKCKMCGGSLEVQKGQTICECEYCGTKQTVSATDDEVVTNLYNRANNLRIKCEFDKAQEIYEKIVAKSPNEAEAYWGIVLCKYGIEYVEDPNIYKRVPTCHRTQLESVLTDVDYLSAIENADSNQRLIYEQEAKEIDKLQKDILATVYKGNIIKNLIMDCQSYTKYRPNETTGGIFVSWRRKEELPTGA